MDPGAAPPPCRRGRTGLVRTLSYAAVLCATGAGSAACANPASAVDEGTPAPGRPVLDPAYRPTGRMAAGDVFVHLFEWRWSDIAAECEGVLGPRGYAAVQVSPPQEHALIAGFPWWQRYQPVSYGIGRSRSGAREEFVDMVARCAGAGVDVYVDAVINHMTAGAGTGSDGTIYTKYEYPGLYTRGDFHSPCEVEDYRSPANVQDCELLGLSDLDTGTASVRERIAGYLVGLVRLGVAGFRLDAAKHIQPVELDGILTLVNETLAREGQPPPYYFAEVIDNGSEAVREADYFGLGHASGAAVDVTEFGFRGVGDKFLGAGGQRPAQLDPGGPQGSRFSEAAWGLMPADKAVVFLENHDTQRDGGIWYRDGDAYRLANVWMLAQPYGHPKVMSSYAFERGPVGRDVGPPSSAAGETLPVACAAAMEHAGIGQWVCEHRDPVIAGMVAFRREVAGTPIERWWDDGASAIAFSRGDRGFVAINGGAAPADVSTTTRLEPGEYCDLLTGGPAAGGCMGTTVVVGHAGSVTLELPPLSAVAIHAGSRR